MSDNTTRVSLLLRLREPGDSTAWSEFDAIYRPMLKRIARARGLDDGDADDVVQHCLLSVSQQIKSFEYDRSKGRFKSWLSTLINNRVRNLHRDRHGAKNQPINAEPEQSREQSPDEIFEQAWMEEHLRFALEQIKSLITPTAYEAYRRSVLDGESVEDVCRAFNLSAGQLYKLKWRMTKKLHERLRGVFLNDESSTSAD